MTSSFQRGHKFDISTRHFSQKWHNYQFDHYRNQWSIITNSPLVVLILTVFIHFNRENVLTRSANCQSAGHWAVSMLTLAAGTAWFNPGSVSEWARQTAGGPARSDVSWDSPEPPDSRCRRTVSPSLLPSKTTRRAPPSSAATVTSDTGSWARPDADYQNKIHFYIKYYILK